MSNEINIPHTFSTLEGKYKRMETEVLISEDLKLSLTTYQRTSGVKELVTYANVSRKLEGHSAPFLYGHRLGQDYNRVFKATKCRVTANAVKAQHGEFLVNLDSIIADAKKYYGVTIVKLEAVK
jgi:hypothetical protein